MTNFASVALWRAEQNSALMGGCWLKMDSDDNRNVISDREDE